MAKVICMTGSPKNFNFSTKAVFLEKLADFDFSEGKMTKKNNVVDILVTDSTESMTTKMKMANELGVEIMTYGELAALFDIEGDIQNVICDGFVNSFLMNLSHFYYIWLEVTPFLPHKQRLNHFDRRVKADLKHLTE